MEIQTIRELLRQGDTGKALEALIALLEKDSRFKDNLLRTLRVAEANYNATRQQELKGILPFEDAQREYNRTTDTVLAVLDDVEAGRVPTTTVAGPNTRRRRMLVILTAVVLPLLVVFGVVLSRDRCPEYSGEAKGLKVLILEFQPITEKRAQPEIVLRGRIEKLTAGKIPVALAIHKGQNVSSPEEAQKIGRRCKADFVIWGLYQAMDRDSFRVQIRSRFTREGGLATDTDFRPLRDVAALANNDQTFRDFDDAFFSLCAMVAIERGRWLMARNWLKRIKNPQAEDMAMQEMVNKRLPM